MKGFRSHLRHKNVYYLLMNWVGSVKSKEGSRMTSI